MGFIIVIIIGDLTQFNLVLSALKKGSLANGIKTMYKDLDRCMCPVILFHLFIRSTR